MRPSLLDRVDLAALRATPGTGPWACVTACLLSPGVVQHDPADPGWSDRDRVVVGDEAAAGALGDRLATAGPASAFWYDASTGSALALARGMAAASELDGGIFRVWCLLGEAALREGDTWEAVAGTPAGSLVLVAVAGPAGARSAALWLGEAGWRVSRARAREPAEVLGGLDRALLPGSPGALVATWDRP